MKAVLMAGGEGSRLRPLTVTRPKPMVPIVNKSVMAHILDLLKLYGITDVVVTLRYMAAAIQDYFEDGANFGVNITYVVEENPLGTAGSVRNAAPFLDDTFMVISGDAFTDFNLAEIIQAHRDREALASLTLTRVPNPLEFGVIVTNDEGRITQFQEKPSWGEIISDTVNTGIYVLEPEVLDLIPPDRSYDFSRHLFPRMLSDRLPTYGHIAEGYWCDIGNVEEYRRANADLLHGRVKSSQPIGQHIGGGVWVGEGVDIAPSAQLFGPVYLGDGVKIKGDVTIYGPSVIRDYTVIDAYSRIERSILWRNNYVGENCELRGAVISRQCSLKSGVVLFEGVVVGDNCVLGESSVLHPDVKLWPEKQIEAGANVKDSIIWGTQARHRLFGRFGVTGVVNVDLTPELAAKLGAALGATLPPGSNVAINRDSHRSSRMLKRALISGIPGTGINVLDLGTVPIPVLRHFVRSNDDVKAGIHVRISPFDQRVVDIRLLNDEGTNLTTAEEREIERSFFREDFRRAYLDEIGLISYAGLPADRYVEDFLHHIDANEIQQKHFRMVIDYSHGLAADTLTHILNHLEIDVVPLNARMDETKLAVLHTQFITNRQRTATIVEALEADLGVQLDVGGEKVFVIDETGACIDDVTAAAVMAELALSAHPGRPIAVPVTLPNAFNEIAARHGSELIRVGLNLSNMLHVIEERQPVLLADGGGNFIFPDFLPTGDGMMASIRLLEYLSHRQQHLSSIVADLPVFHLCTESVDCPVEDKGTVMRILNQRFRNDHTDNTDGMKIWLENGEWVHFVPDPEKPACNITAEAACPERAQQLVQECINDVREMLTSEA